MLVDPLKPDQLETRFNYFGKAGYLRQDWNRDGGITPSEFQGEKEQDFKKYDCNKDGILNFPEWFIFHMSGFERIDHNKDGLVSYTEYMHEHDQLDQNAQAEGIAWFKHADNGDGTLSELSLIHI